MALVVSRKRVVISAVAVLAAWAACGLSALAAPNVQLSDGLLVIWIAVFFSGAAVIALVRAWRGAASANAAVVGALLAVVSALGLAFLIALSNH